MARRRRKRESVIKNYGIMWRRDEVSWGAGSNRGTLEGRRSGKPIDFRNQIGVYVLYDENRRSVYVGQAGRGKRKSARLYARLNSHRRGDLAHRWTYFSWFGLLRVNKSGKLTAWDDPNKRVRGTIKSTLDEIEGVLIAATEPQFNKQGANFKHIEKFKQVRRTLESDPTTIEDLWDRFDRLDKKVERVLSKVKKVG